MICISSPSLFVISLGPERLAWADLRGIARAIGY
jgi:hypothetical protein